MTYYKRDLEKKLKSFAKFPAIALLGPRQSGKSTLAQHVFNKHVFLNLEDMELRRIALEDPKGFLRKYENEHGIILDEFQNCPDLLSYIQVIVDEKKRPGYFVLTGSQNFLMNEAISQSLAGRVGILTLLPLSINELTENKLIDSSHPEETIYKGGYPRLYADDFTPPEFFPSYTQTYVQRDIRQLVNVKNLNTFNKFIKLCAARIGQLLNFTDLATNCGISVPTVHEWLSILEASYIIFLLRPHWNNYNKRITKSPKIYFYDTGLACYVLEITSSKELLLNPFYGNIFEGLIISDLYKQFFNQGLSAPLYFWRDKNGSIEVGCLLDQNAQITPIEIKSGETFDKNYFKAIKKWNLIAQKPEQNSYVIYGGSQSFSKENKYLIPWNMAGTLIDIIKQKKASNK